MLVRLENSVIILESGISGFPESGKVYTIQVDSVFFFFCF